MESRSKGLDRLIHAFSIMLMLCATVFVAVVFIGEGIPNPEYADAVTWVPVALLLSSIPAGYFVPKALLNTYYWVKAGFDEGDK